MSSPERDLLRLQDETAKVAERNKELLRERDAAVARARALATDLYELKQWVAGLRAKAREAHVHALEVEADG